MSNRIDDKLDELGNVYADFKEIAEKRFENIEKGTQSRDDELNTQLDRANQHIEALLKEVKGLKDEKESSKVRLEILEALQDKPHGPPIERAEKKDAKLFEKLIRSGFKDPDAENELKMHRKYMRELEQKADSVLSQTALQGGNDVPKIIADAIETLVLAQSDIYQEVNVVTSGSPDYNEIVTIAGANGGWSAEAGSRSQSNAPNFRKVTITHGELYAFPRVSNWSLQDLQHDVIGIINQDAADTMAISISTAIHAGSGSSQPTGMTHSAPTNGDDYASPMRAAAVYEYIATGSSPTSTAVSYGDLVDLQAALRRPYQSNAKWAMNSTTRGALRKLVDTTGQPLWQPSLQLGTPDMLLGKPVFIWEDMATQAASALPIAYGDFRRAYTYAKIGGMTMIRDNVTVPGFTNFLIAQRAGGIPRNNDAVKFLKLIAS